MKQRLNIGKEPNIQKIIITSAVMHILFIALAAVPLRTKEREYKSYFVNLVAPIDIQRTLDTTSSRVLLRRAKEAAKTNPEKENQNDKTQSNRAKSEEQSSLKKTFGNQENLSSELLWQTEKDKIPSKKKFEITRDYQKPKGEYHQDAVPVDKGYSGTTFAATEDFQKQQYTIARETGAAQTETVPKDLKSDLHGNSGMESKRNAQFGSLGQREGSKLIAKPGLSSGSRDGGIMSQGQGAQIAINTASGGDKIISNNEKLSTSEISIHGVPLGDLIACTNALDEGILKKKILNVIGYRKECYSAATGKFVFLGADRYTSFEMIILPVSGRKLSNRCDELKNALFCLESIKE